MTVTNFKISITSKFNFLYKYKNHKFVMNTNMPYLIIQKLILHIIPPPFPPPTENTKKCQKNKIFLELGRNKRWLFYDYC